MSKTQFLVSAAIAGIVAAGSISSTALAADKTAEKGLCSNANNSCKGGGACGEAKGKNECKGHGNAMMTKAQCDKMAKTDKDKGVEHTFMAAPEKKM